MDEEFAVIDLETTGLFPGKHDRVVEVASLVLGPDGALVDEYVTLVNPHRDVGPVHIHGITATELSTAPGFRDVAGDLVHRMKGRILAGHNVLFDLRFLVAEFSRLGFGMPSLPVLCTLQLSRQILGPLPAHRLENCCAAVGLNVGVAHRAREDAHATAMLLGELLRRGNDWRRFVRLVQGGSDGGTWPAVAPTGKEVRRGSTTGPLTSDACYLASLVRRLPTTGDSEETSSYLMVLERALEDRVLTATEAEDLLEVARACGLSRECVERLHIEYLRQLVRVALADAALSAFERRDLERVAGLLSIPEGTLQELFLELESRSSGQDAAHLEGGSDSLLERPNQLRGLSVCFSGTLGAVVGGAPVTRDRAHLLATNTGMTVCSSVTRRLDVLVVSDPYSESSKARRARELGVRIMSEAAFWAAIGVRVGNGDSG